MIKISGKLLVASAALSLLGYATSAGAGEVADGVIVLAKAMPWACAIAAPASPPPQITLPGAEPQALPGGDNDVYRQRMLSWQGKLAYGRTKQVAMPLLWPLAQTTRISSSFGTRADPLGGGLRFHAGVDIPGTYGTRISTVAQGIVAFAGRASGYGNLIVVDHDGGLRTRYGHLSHLLVDTGQRIETGEVIGLMGSTGRSTGSHLHYEVRVDGAAVNPLASNVYAMSEPRPRYAQIPVAEHWAGWTCGTAGEFLPMATIR